MLLLCWAPSAYKGQVMRCVDWLRQEADIVLAPLFAQLLDDVSSWLQRGLEADS